MGQATISSLIPFLSARLPISFFLFQPQTQYEILSLEADYIFSDGYEPVKRFPTDTGETCMMMYLGV